MARGGGNFSACRCASACRRASGACRRARKRAKGEAVEIAWAPPDHPSALWEATIVQVRAHQAKVRFVGFDASWDQWLPHDSEDMFPARPLDGHSLLALLASI